MRPANTRRARTIPAAVGLLAAALAGSGAGAANLTVGYNISLGGFGIGTAEMTASFEGERYEAQISARMTGLMGAVTGGKGAATAAGTVAGARPAPLSFAVNSRSSNDQRSVRIGLNGGNVAAVEITPPLEEKPDRVPLKEAHKRGVVDPVSAVLMPVTAAGGDAADPANCNRTIPVFDGASRFDVVLTYAETRRVEKGGYSGPVLVCSARYLPVAGHRAGRPAIKFMQDNRDMSVWLAPVAGARILVPLQISVKTMIGTSVVEASKWALQPDVTGSTSGRSGRRARAE